MKTRMSSFECSGNLCILLFCVVRVSLIFTEPTRRVRVDRMSPVEGKETTPTRMGGAGISVRLLWCRRSLPATPTP